MYTVCVFVFCLFYYSEFVIRFEIDNNKWFLTGPKTKQNKQKCPPDVLLNFKGGWNLENEILRFKKKEWNRKGLRSVRCCTLVGHVNWYALIRCHTYRCFDWVHFHFHFFFKEMKIKLALISSGCKSQSIKSPSVLFLNFILLLLKEMDFCKRGTRFDCARHSLYDATLLFICYFRFGRRILWENLVPRRDVFLVPPPLFFSCVTYVSNPSAHLV